MELELDIIDSLQALSYKGDCLQQDVLSKALNNGISSPVLRALVFWLADQLHVLRKTDEHISSSNNNDEFIFELSLLLTELGCPYRQFVTVPMSERYQTRDSLLQLLDYLTSELMGTKMSLRLQAAVPPSKRSKVDTAIEDTVRQLISDLQLGDMPKNINAKMLRTELTAQLDRKLSRANSAVLSQPLLRTNKPLTDAQWRVLEAMHRDLDAEYNLRRQMMLTRLEATIQSFQWSETMKHRQSEIAKKFEPQMLKLQKLKLGGDDTNIVALLAARADLAIIEKTSSANVRKNTATKIQKHVIGSVPDRGGRANEHAPPPPEMPAWQQQRAGGPAGGGGGRGGGGRGGGSGGGGGRGGGDHFRGRGDGGGSAHGQQPQPQRDQQWMGGSGRVQGSGWNQHGAGRGRGRGYGGERGGGGGGRGYNQRNQNDYQRGGFR